MALTKVTKSGITDNAVDADKIEDGTIVAADIATGTITNAKLAGSIANDKLANSSITVNGSSVSLGGSVSAGSIEWQTVKTSGFTAVAGEGYFCNTNGGAFTATLPASPSAGDTIAFKDYGDDFGTNALTIGRNGKNIQGLANDSEITTDRASIVCVFIDDTKGWLYTNESNVAALDAAAFVTATGGTITTVDTNFKVHTFTGDGCFIVSDAGNPGGSTAVDYLVVAGGGGGGGNQGGGGGAGGHRTTFPSPGCNAGAFAISVATFPIQVGAGGSGSSISPNCAGTIGANSIFSTITSTGGGLGGGGSIAAGNGGSGGGAQGRGPVSGGTGNTPPVSPSQGNTGGGAPTGDATGGGGGGAGAVGTNGGPRATVAPGGAGTANSITGSSVTRSGGGGAGQGGSPPQGGGAGAGGAGGGGQGGDGGATSVVGTVNTGGGGGGGANPAATGPSGFDAGKNGGSGIVIIRYKFQ